MSKPVNVTRLEAFEMLAWRRMRKAKWTDKKTNEEVLRLVNETPNLKNVIKRRKKRWASKFLRHDSLILLALE